MRIRLFHTEGFRLSAIYAGVFALSVLLMGIVVLLAAREEFRDQIVQFSRGDIAAIQRGYDSEDIPEAREVVEQLMGVPRTSAFFLLQKGTQRIAGNLPPMPAREGIVSLPGASPGDEILGTGAILAPGLYAFAGSDTYSSRLALQHITHILVGLFVVAILLAVMGGALLSRSFLRRTDAMAKTCRAIMDGDIKARIPVRGTRDELDRLAGAINEMLDRIWGLMENLRQITNDVAHDLRTPVTHLRHRLERARSESATAEDYAQALEAAIAKSDEILALFAALLRIAQIEGGARRAGFSRIELASLLSHMRDLFGAVAEEAGDRLQLGAVQNAIIRGDRELLVQLFSNLIENAILHTPLGTHIALGLRLAADRAIVTVSDNGPGVPAEEHEKLFQRLYRREASRTKPGYGLGLSLVVAVAELHGATIRIAEQAGPGLSVEMSFPLATAP